VTAKKGRPVVSGAAKKQNAGGDGFVGTSVLGDVFTRTFNGVRAALILPTIPDDAPHDVREGVARRRIIMTTGECPCGGRFTGPNRETRRAILRDQRNGTPDLWHATVYHEDNCPALDETLLAAIARWRG